MSIFFDEKEKTFELQTDNTCYQFMVDKTGLLKHLYYGRRVGKTIMDYRLKTCDRGFSGNPYDFQEDRGCSADIIPQEYSTFGTGDYRPASILTVLPDGSRSLELKYAGHHVEDGKYQLEGLPYVREGRDKVQTLAVELKDETAGISVSLYYGVFEQKDVITRTARITNLSDDTVQLNKAASFCIDFPYGSYDVIHFSGRHCMERNPERIRLTQSTVTVESKRGMSSHHANPFVILCDHAANENNGDCYGFMLAYSGNHKEEISKDQTGSVRIMSGIHDEGFCWKLESKEAFQTPEAILTYSAKGFNGLSVRLHRLLRDHVCAPGFIDQPLPVLLNSWEACYFDFDTQKLLKLADESVKLGVELFVLDDGWFGSRTDDHRGLGDWKANESRLPGGLKYLSQEIHARGLKFGIWVEPEMVNEDSDLYRRHPDWALSDPGRRPVVARNQLVLDMTRQDVRDYLFASISALLEDAQIEYIKWDFNRSISNAWSGMLPADRQGEVMHRFVLGTYELLGRIRESFPEVLIEGCSGGGGRFDAGMLFYCPQIWCSDNTDAYARLFIQRGTSYGYPPAAMGSHVSASPNHQTGRSMPFKTRGITAMSGAFGYELNPASLSEDEKGQIRHQIDTYHRFEHLIRRGDYYRLGEEDSPFISWEAVSADGKEALVSIVITALEANSAFAHVKLKGLDPERLYQVEGVGEDAAQGDGRVLTGAALMYGGYVFSAMAGDFPGCQIYLKAVGN